MTKTRSLSLLNKRSLLLVTALVAAVGCSGTRDGVQKNGVCSAIYNPMNVDDEKAYASKVQLKSGEPLAIADADYGYNGAEFYFYDTDRDIKIHLEQVKATDGTEKINVKCAGGKGLRYDMEPSTYSIEFISDMLVEGPTVKIKRKVFSFDLRHRPGGQPLEMEVRSLDDDFVDGSPQDFYAAFPEGEQYFLSLKGNPVARQLVARLKDIQPDQKSGKDVNIVTRTLVNLKVFTPEERRAATKK